MQGLVETLNANARTLRRTGLGGFVASVTTRSDHARTVPST
jgi:hypothetical protein